MEVGVFALIKDAEGKMLLVKDATRQELWSLPGGGLEFQELLPNALAREVKEETSLEVEPGKILGIFSQKKTPGIVILFEASVVEGIPTPDGTESQECAFFSWGEILAIKDEVKPAQLSMIYQALTQKEFPIFNHFVAIN